MDAEERRFKALDFLLDYSKGTLWWVNDLLWEKSVPNFVRRRKGHPGLSICRTKATGLFTMIPMLLGTTKSYGKSFCVNGVSDPESGRGDKPTHFSLLRPYPLVFDEFGRVEGISRNDYKPRLTAEEGRRLDAYLKREGI